MTEQGFTKGQSDNLPEVDAIMVAEFLANSGLFTSVEMRGVMAKRAERESYGDAAVGYVQLQRRNNICTVMCKICPEHKVRSKNYTVIMEVNEAEGKILKAECQDCAASAGGCKHMIAFIMWVHRRSGEPSRTEVESYWKRPKLSGIGSSLKFVTVNDFRQQKEDNINPDPNEKFLEKFVQKGLEAKGTSQIFHHYVKDRMLSLGIHQLLCLWNNTSSNADADDFILFAASNMSRANCDEAFEKSKAQAESGLWHNLRYGRITASKLYQVACCKTPAGSLVESIIGGYKKFDTPAMQRGRNLEDKVLATLEKKMGKKFQRGGLMLAPNYPVFGASPDGFCEEFVIEIKCPTSEKTVSNYLTSGNTPTKRYCAQVQMQMLFMKKKQALFCVADPRFEENNKFTLVFIDYDEEFVTNIMENVLMFWKKNIFSLLSER